MKLPLLIATTIGAALFALDAAAQNTSSTATSTTTAPSPAAGAPAATSTTSATQSAAVAPDAAPPVTPSTTSALVTTQNGPPVEDVPTEETTSPVNRPLLTTGAVILGGTYAASAIDAAASGRPEDHKYLYYPVVGPWMDLANRNCGATPCGNGSNETLNKALLIADGIGQGIGLVGMVASLFIPETTTRHWVLIGNDKVQAGPTMVGTGYGLGAVGRF